MFLFLDHTNALRVSDGEDEEGRDLQARREVPQRVPPAPATGGLPEARCSQGRQLLRAGRAEARVRGPHSRHQQDPPASAQGAPALPSPADQQRRVREAEQGHHPDAANRRPVHRVGLPLPEDHPRARLQARLRQGPRPAHPHHRQLHRRGEPW